jgi:bifunctional DNA-binding transcriptional regulator/antitoxin component of YhaV-PrlF toxin-antitoxin module
MSKILNGNGGGARVAPPRKREFVTLHKAGNSEGVYIPKGFRKHVGFKEGDLIRITLQERKGRRARLVLEAVD